MPNDTDLRSEIEALRREIEEMRAEHAGAGKSGEGAEAAGGAGSASEPDFIEQLRTLAQEISEFAENTEKGVVHHPLTSVLGALVVGILIGRIWPR